MKNKSYLCNVFFMVLDFKVNEKGLSSDSPFFLSAQPKLIRQTPFKGHSTSSLRAFRFPKSLMVFFATFVACG